MKIKYSLAALLVISSLNATEDLGIISVESSTIDDKFETKTTEISNTTNITEEQISKINPTSIENILNTIPGITASNVGNDRVKIHIRGIDNQMYMGEKPGVAIVIDGVPVQETTGKINLDLDNIASIKVIKGSASYLYGNDAIAGAIVITTKRPKGLSSSKLETELGTFGFKRLLASTNQSFEIGSLQLQGSSRENDGYWDDAYLKHKSINGKYQHYITDSSDLTFGLDYTKRKTGDGTSIHGETESILNPKSVGEVSYAGYYDTTLVKTFLTYSNDIDDTSNLMLNISRYEDDTSNRATPNATDTDHTKLSVEEWIQNSFKTEYRKSFDKFAIMTGIDMARNSQKSNDTARIDYIGYSGAVTTGTVLGDSKNNEDINALYIEVQNQLTDSLTSTLNFRHDTIKYDYKNNLDATTNATPSYNENSYRLGFNYKLSNTHNIYTSYATGFRAPTAEQISGNLDKLNSDPTLDIPTSLDAEKTTNLELGIRGNIASFKYDASIYQLDRKDYLGVKAGSYIRSTDDDEELATFNLGDMRSKGFELALNSDMKKDISFTAAYTYLDAKFKKYTLKQLVSANTAAWNQPSNAIYQDLNLAGNYVPRTSKHTLNLAIDFKVNENITISPELIVKSSYYADELNKFKQPGYEIINLRSEYKFNKSLEFFAKIENLFDKGYNQFVNVSSSDVSNDMEDATIRVAPPRAYYAGLRYKF